MSQGSDAFINSIGKPDIATPNGIHFKKASGKIVWESLHEEIGSGWFLNRFLYLFGEELDQLEPCLNAWSFLVRPGIERMIIGRNAYGALLVAEEPTKKGFVCPVYLLDPITVRYWHDPNLDFGSLIGYWLPEGQLLGFLDCSLYEAWVKVTGDFLALDEVLGIKVPISLGGEITPENFQIERIIEYYQTTGPIYAEALNQANL